MFPEPPGSYNICKICFWEDDAIALRWPLDFGGANAVLLAEAQRNYFQFGAMEQRFSAHVRPPSASDRKDAGWRLIDLATDRFERVQLDQQASWPAELEADLTQLYYWRDTFWHR
jgi:hypothetical protein